MRFLVSSVSFRRLCSLVSWIGWRNTDVQRYRSGNLESSPPLIVERVPPFLLANTAILGLCGVLGSIQTFPGSRIVLVPASLEEVLHFCVGPSQLDGVDAGPNRQHPCAHVPVQLVTRFC